MMGVDIAAPRVSRMEDIEYVSEEKNKVKEAETN